MGGRTILAATTGPTWGVSGPWFLFWYSLLMAGTIGVVMRWRDRLVARPHRWVASREALGPHEVAYLMGGPDRVKLVALMALVEQGRLRLDRGRFASAGDDPADHRPAADHREADHPLDRLAYDEALTGQPIGWTRDTVADHLAPAVFDILRVPPEAHARRWFPALLPVPVLVLGLARLVVGSDPDWSEAILGIVLVVGGLLLVGLLTAPLALTLNVVVRRQIEADAATAGQPGAWRRTGDQRTMDVALAAFDILDAAERDAVKLVLPLSVALGRYRCDCGPGPHCGRRGCGSG